ncbi:uncharacterized protein [Cicer arietinum]|uniref:uncharacterized protein n=1 Tax=Cicer arietinum TaxID=3827 RepID=UPI00032A638D
MYEFCEEVDGGNINMPSLFDGERFDKQVQEAKVNLLVGEYEMFKMEEDEDIETLFSRFQTLVSGLKLLEKSYTTTHHVKKIIRSLPNKWKLNITSIQEAKDLNTLKLEELISSLRSHESELTEDEPKKK